MDTSERYIGEIYDGWDLLRELWHPSNLDWVARNGTLEQVISDFLPSYSDEKMVVKSCEDNQVTLYGWKSTLHKDKLICAFRQDQLQEMLRSPDYKGNWVIALGTRILAPPFEYKRLYDFDSMEQLWLAFVMKERYNKIWSTEKEGWVSQSK